jgi:hemolysin III
LYRRCDHAAIFVMIAGTATPFLLLPSEGWWRSGACAALWIAAATGSVIKIAAPERLERGSVPLYLALGWAATIGLAAPAEVVPIGPYALLGIGGAVYSLGVPFHAAHRLRFHNAIWHAFVLAAAACHYAAVLGLLLEEISRS